jgi:hypothetical protein
VAKRPDLDIDLERRLMLKTLRTLIRHKHSLEADRELYEVLPRVQAEFDKRVLRGELPDAIDIKRLLALSANAD